MKNKGFYALWGAAYILCVLLGFVPQPAGFLKVLMVVLSLAFFLPGGILLYRSIRDQDKQTRKTIRLISAASLILTLLALVANFLVVFASPLAGALMYVLLVIVSAPMAASGYWVLSMFLWACLLMGSFLKVRK